MIPSVRSFSLICLLFAFVNGLFGQSSPRFRHLSVEEGLTQASITAIHKDRYGFMWLGSRDGLNRYDSYQIKQFKFDKSDSTSLSNNTISCITDDAEGHVWIGTEGGGINVYRETADLFVRIRHDPGAPHSLPDDYVFALARDSKGRIWAGTNSGFSSIDPGDLAVVNYRIPDESGKEVDVRVNHLYADEDGSLWLATEGQGLLNFSPETGIFTHYKNNPGDPSSIGSNILNHIHDDGKGTLWIGTWGFGLIRHNKKTGRFQLYRHQPGDRRGIPNDNIFSIVHDENGLLWLGTRDGLCKMDPETGQATTFRKIPANPLSLADNVVFSMFYDKDSKMLWVGTWGGGLNMLDKFSRNILHYQNIPGNAESLSHNDVFAFQEDPAGNLWIGTEGGGLNYFNRQLGSFKTYQHDPASAHSLSSNDIYTFEYDRKGRLWIGTANGLNYIDPGGGSIERYKFSQNYLKNQTILSLCADSHGYLWISWSLEGVTRLNLETGDLKQYWTANEPVFGDVSSMFEDYMGQMWFGSRSSGLCRLNVLEDRATYFKNKPNDSTSLASNSIYALCQDSKGRIWIGTRGGGLNLILLKEDGSQVFKSYTIQDGLTDDWVYGINEDRNGNIWVSSSEGLSVIRSNSTTIQSSRMLTANQGAFYKGDQSGTFYLGTNGFDQFRPELLEFGTPKYHMVIHTLKKYNEARHTGVPEEVPALYTKEEITLSHRDNLIEIGFLNIDFESEGERMYAYMMEHFNDDWIRLGTQRNITFTGLPPGNYEFRVRPVLASGELGTETAGIRLKIPPPWYWNSIAIIVYLLLLTGLILGYIQFRTKSLKMRQKQLELVVSERTQQLEAKNEEVIRQRERSEELLLNILPRDVAEELKTAGHTSPVKYDEVSVLFADFKEYTNIVASIPGIKLVKELDDIFQHFDEIMEETGLEKIQTVGDAYLAVCGLPKPADDHAHRCVRAAIKMIDYLNARNQNSSLKWKIRIGIHSGPVIAGIVGKKKFSYDIFGDTVNLAARVQTESEEGRINVSAYTHDLIKDAYALTYRGKIHAKGKGDLDMYFVEVGKAV